MSLNLEYVKNPLEHPISNTTRLLNLDKDIISYISKGELTSGHGKVILGIKDKKQQLNFAERIIKNNLNVRETEGIVSGKHNPIKKDKNNKNNKSKDSNVIDLEEKLMSILGTRVSLVQGNKKGKIEIEYYGYEDLERIIDVLTN